MSPLEVESSIDTDIARWADDLINGVYWNKAHDDDHRSGLALVDEVAGCFDAAGRALELVATRGSRPGTLAALLPLIAEAQSMLRRAIQRISTAPDGDQLAVYEWLRQTSARHRIYLERYMRADDLADPSLLSELCTRIEMLSGPSSASGRAQTRAERQANKPTTDPDRDASREKTPEVQEAARLLRRQRVVLIGGLRHPQAQETLREGLDLKEILWIETKEHQAVDTFEPSIARPDVALVLLAIRWSSHAFGEVKTLCDRHGKPLVRLPGGYGLNQVAAQILDQCSGRLEPRRSD